MKASTKYIQHLESTILKALDRWEQLLFGTKNVTRVLTSFQRTFWYFIIVLCLPNSSPSIFISVTCYKQVLGMTTVHTVFAKFKEGAPMLFNYLQLRSFNYMAFWEVEQCQHQTWLMLFSPLFFFKSYLLACKLLGKYFLFIEGKKKKTKTTQNFTFIAVGAGFSPVRWARAEAAQAGGVALHCPSSTRLIPAPEAEWLLESQQLSTCCSIWQGCKLRK